MHFTLLLASLCGSAFGAPIELPLGAGLAQSPVPAQAPTTFQAAHEMRAGWVVGWRQIVSTAAIDDAIDLAQTAGLNTLFVQVRVNADAYYHSDIVPRAEELLGQSADFDPLDYALKRGHAKGFSVHAWMNLGSIWRSTSTPPTDPRHIFNAHPEWVLKDESGQFSVPRPSDPQPGYVEENHWLNWGHPGAQAHLVAVVGELARRYPVDGVHFDFVRYPARMGPRTTGVGYDAVSVRRFKEETGRTPAERTSAWDDWRKDQVTAALKACREEIRTARPRAQVSAAVLAAWNLAAGRNFTSYRRWLEADLLDFVVLMSYFKDHASIWQSALNAREVADGRKIALGLFMRDLSAEQAAREIEMSRDMGLKGFAFFSLDRVGRPDAKPYLAGLRRLAIPPVDDARYDLREPLWNRVAVTDAEHRAFALRFYSRTGRTKLVLYPRGAGTLKLALPEQEFLPLKIVGPEPVQIDLSPWLKPDSRNILANHDFTLTVAAEGAPEFSAEIFTVDYYNPPITP